MKSLSLPTKAYIALVVASGMACLTLAAIKWQSEALLGFLVFSAIALLGITSCVFFFLNTIQVAIVIALSEKRSLWRLWRECYFWSFPYYVLGAALAGALSFSNHVAGWTVYALVVPVIYIIFRSYRSYLGRLEDEQAHNREIAQRSQELQTEVAERRRTERSEEHTSELQSQSNLVCRLLLEK